MRLKSLISLPSKQFDIHFPDSCRARQLDRLSSMTELLQSVPVDNLRDAEVASTLANVEILLTGWATEPLDIELRSRMPKLKLVAHLAGTVKAVLSPEIAASGIRVISAASANARPVAEFTLAHILLHLKRVEEWRREYRLRRSTIDTRGSSIARAMEGCGRTVGIVGASRIGRKVAAHLKHHEVSVLLYDPFVDADAVREIGAVKVSMDELLQRSDVVTLHQPLLPTTERSFGERQFALMRDGALLINTARGRIVDTSALERAMSGGRLHAVLDVTDPEPLNDDSPLWNMKNVLITPHIAGSFGCEVCGMTDMVLDDIDRFVRGEAMMNEIVPDDWERVA